MLLVSMNFYKNMLTFRYLFLLKNVSTIPYFFKPFEFNSNATQIFFCFHLNCIFFHEFNRNIKKKRVKSKIYFIWRNDLSTSSIQKLPNFMILLLFSYFFL